MSSRSNPSKPLTVHDRPPAKTIEERENQLISLAIDRAEQQLRDGTASAQVITHYLKLGSTRERLEKEIMQSKIELDRAKTESLQASKHAEELFSKALSAFRSYNGMEEDYEDQDIQ